MVWLVEWFGLDRQALMLYRGAIFVLLEIQHGQPRTLNDVRPHLAVAAAESYIPSRPKQNKNALGSTPTQVLPGCSFKNERCHRTGLGYEGGNDTACEKALQCLQGCSTNLTRW